MPDYEGVAEPVVGDTADDLRRALDDGFGYDLLCVSGGLGPTHDDRTVELLAAAAGVSLRVDPELEAQIEKISRTVAERLRRPYADFAEGVTKQATVPEGAIVVGADQLTPPLVDENADSPKVSIGTTTLPFGCTSGCPPIPVARFEVVVAAPQVRPPSLDVLIRIWSPAEGSSHSM